MVCGRESLLGKRWIIAFMKCHKSSRSRGLCFLRSQLPVQGAQIYTEGKMFLECKPVILWIWDAEDSQENTISVKITPFCIQVRKK